MAPGTAAGAELAAETKQPLTFRARRVTLAELRRRAHEAGVSQTSLAERYLEEGLRRDIHPQIDFRDGAGGRRAALVGTRLDVWQVIETLGEGESRVDDAAAYLEIPVDKVHACVRYYADFQVEIDDWISRVTSVRDREHELWHRQREVLG